MDEVKIKALSKTFVQECSKLAGTDDIEFSKMFVAADKIVNLSMIVQMKNFPEFLRGMANVFDILYKETEK